MMMGFKTRAELESENHRLRERAARLEAVLREVADEPEVDGRCDECVTPYGYHETWCFRGKAIAALAPVLAEEGGCSHEHVDYVKPARCRDCDTLLSAPIEEGG